MLKMLNGNLLCAVDVETTGVMFGYHEIIQVAVLPLNHLLKPSEDYKPFYMNIAPSYPERASEGANAKHGLDVNDFAACCVSQARAADLLDEWFMSLELPLGKKVIPLAHNYAFERGFLTHWLGLPTFEAIFHVHPRDTMLLAASLNDINIWHRKNSLYDSIGLANMCKYFGIELVNAHDALADCVATAALYREIIMGFG